MTNPRVLEILQALLSTTSPQSVRKILQDIGDRSDLSLDEPFGDGFLWHAFGDNPSNLATIGLGTKPGRSLTERITNAIDALLEDRVLPGIALPQSPRMAAQQWFGRPASGPDSGLYRWNYGTESIDRRINVILLPGDSDDAPTVDVLDDGIGIEPEQFRQTILSLQAGNKITKRYLVGAFGQGGSATLAFCDFALIVSRHKARSGEIGFTIIRVLNLPETYKEDSFAYLCMVGDSINDLRIPAIGHTGDFGLYPSRPGLRLPSLAKGTVVRHYGYRLDRLSGTFAPSPGNLYHYLHSSLFDPLFPFRVVDLRVQERSELVTGSRNRLMRLTQKQQAAEEEAGSEVRHYREMEFVVPYGEQDAAIGIEYWVVLNYRKGTGAKKDEFVLRSQSNSLFVDPGHPIIGSMNGQNQGELTTQLLRDIGLGLVSRHMIIHFDASTASSRVRRQLFATNREGFKDGPVMTHLLQILRQMLEEDQNLFAIERDLTEKASQRETQTTNDEVKRQVTKLLLDAGFRVSQEGPAFAAGGSDAQPIRQQRRGKHFRPDPLLTLLFPQVTRFEIVVPEEDSFAIHQGDVEVVLIETDADSEFDRRGLIALRVEPPVLELAAKSPLRGGRIRWRLRTTESASVGSRGSVVATITRPDGSQLTDRREFEVRPPVEDSSKKARGQVPPFDIIPINPDDDPDKWGKLGRSWPTKEV